MQKTDILFNEVRIILGFVLKGFCNVAVKVFSTLKIKIPLNSIKYNKLWQLSQILLFFKKLLGLAFNDIPFSKYLVISYYM